MSQDKTTISTRQVIRFTTIDEVMKVAHIIYASGSTTCSKPEQVAMMLIAGGEVGFGVAQSMAFVTPPLNGRCTLYGNAGLALIRGSGQLESFAERVEGDGDDRKAVVTIRRRGYPEKEFTYSIAQAKKLKSYKSAQTKGGPWADDPDNMLTWRARWKGFNTEFTDILCGMGGAEEQEETITVEASPSPPVAGAITAGTGGTTSTTPALPAATNDQLTEIVRLNGLMKQQISEGTDPAGVWAELLKPFAVGTARELSPDQADQFIREVGSKYDPFTYPTATPVAT